MAGSRESGLTAYRQRRDFTRTVEPRGRARARRGNLYVIQKHAARALHYDFRLQVGDVLKSWAVPKGPSLDPGEKRLAVRTEDHPVDYGSFEGTIPEGEYGGGTVMLWDTGEWNPEGDPSASLEQGKLTFTLRGERLRGTWSLVRMRGGRRGDDKRENWLLIRDRHGATADRDEDEPAEQFTTSVISGRSMNEIATGKERPKPSKRRRKGASKKPKSGSLPRFVPPMLATLVDTPPDGDDWLHEVKWDGYRIQAAIAGDEVRLLSRNRKDWTHRFPGVAEALGELAVEDALIDGEAAVIGEDNRTDFSQLQAALTAGTRIDYLAFDLLRLDGKDLRQLPLLERKERLSEVISAAKKKGPVQYSAHLVGKGAAVYAEACRLRLEGIVSKKPDSTYVSGRKGAWQKAKCTNRQEFVIGGMRPSSKAGRPLSSLLVGAYEKGALRYQGRVGAGFNAADLGKLHGRLKSMERRASPFADIPREAARDAVWVAPKLVAELAFAERTADGHLRHPVFKGLREDKAPDDVAVDLPKRKPSSARVAARPNTDDAGQEDAMKKSGIRLTHPDKVLFPERGITKAELAGYLDTVADRMMPHLARRLVSLIRCPQGRQKKCFFQRHYAKGMPEGIEPHQVTEKDGGVADYIYLANPRAIVAGAQFGVLEYHLWGATIDALEHPDRLTFDLDPGDSVSFDEVKTAAREVRDLLTAAGLESFPMLTGGKGIHVVSPIEPTRGWHKTERFARRLAERLTEADPDRYISEASKARRKGRVFVDWLRNIRAASAVAPFSPRARAGAPVAMPIGWHELGRIDSPAAYSIETAGRRLQALKKDPWQGFFEARQELSDAVLAFFD